MFWLPVRADAAGGSEEPEDVAVLEFDDRPPDAARPIRLVAVQEVWGHGFRAFGFPSGQGDGVYASGVLRAPNAVGWVQIEDVKVPGFRVEPGFSGGPVWDEDLGGVVGMAVAAVRAPEVRAAFIIPTSLLVRAWPPLGRQTIPPCPYRGLFAFREEDSPFFFGRERDTNRLIEATAKKPLVAVVGASGGGKSSVVAAGLFPRLRREGDWLILSFRPGKDPFLALATALLPFLETEKSETDRQIEVNKQAEALRQGDIRLRQAVERVLQKNTAARRLLLLANQFEELYTLCKDAKDRQRFLDELLAAVRPVSGATPDVTLLLTLRADFLGHALSHRPLADALQDADLKLGPMTRQELQEAVEKPAEQLHVRLEEGLAERILSAVDASPGRLPLLEFALTLLWKQQEGGALTHAAYERIGGVEQALTVYAEEVFRRLSTHEQEQSRRIFVQLVRPGEGTRDTRRAATRAEVGEGNWDLVTRLATDRLLVSTRDEAAAAPGVLGVEKLFVRKTGLEYLVDIHIEVDPQLSVRDGHAVGHLVKDRLMKHRVTIKDVLVYIEPAPGLPAGSVSDRH